MDVLKVIVQFETQLIDIGCCDTDHISLISLVHKTCERHTRKSKVPEENHDVRVFLPWCDGVVEVHTDAKLIQVFKKFQEKGLDEISVQVEQKPDLEEMSNYESDNEEVGGVVVGGEDAVGDDDIFNECMRLFEGNQAKSDDEFDSDSDREQPEAKVVRLMKGTHFQRMVWGGIQFHVGQTHDSMDKLRDTFRDYAIQEGVELDRTKNQKCRLTYRCKAKGCPWRIHASCMIDKVTVMIKTYNDKHECHRVYNNVEAKVKAKVKWISSEFETLIKSNPDIIVNVIADLLREKYMVSVDMQRLYKAKKRALKGLAADHANCFQHLKRSAYTVNQLNPGSAIYISLQQPLPTFHRLFLSFEAQKLGFLEGCRPFIDLDGCHLNGPFGGVLLSAMALDTNSGLYPLAVCICEKKTKYSWL
ncbi:hypothetical protein Dsin_026885 [Dipteronia sinensis]|uniref:Transposase MuDR plant domain-containing protein n=1 Tax=Dipteronia sinensis TaxID=43782 RepID=A0AAD9ZYH3_9ROSI|nr:hypothetical protein Dsin_026885 [Dipteronia sinensis]